MAYMNQAMKSELAPAIKAVFKKYGVKGSIAVRNHITLVVNIKSGKLDIIENWFETVKQLPKYNYGGNIQKPTHISVNEYHIDSDYTGEVAEFLKELKSAMEGPKFFNHDDCQTDYFNRSHYIDINIGFWDKPYIVEA